MGRRKIRWQHTDYVLGFFGKKESGARGEYGRFVRKGIEQGKRPYLTVGGLLRRHGVLKGIKLPRETGDYQKGDERILEDGKFIEEILKRAEERFKAKYSLKAKCYNLESLIRRVAKLTELTPE